MGKLSTEELDSDEWMARCAKCGRSDGILERSKDTNWKILCEDCKKKQSAKNAKKSGV